MTEREGLFLPKLSLDVALPAHPFSIRNPLLLHVRCFSVLKTKNQKRDMWRNTIIISVKLTKVKKIKQ